MRDTTEPKTETTPPPDPQHNRSSKALLFVMLGIILATFLAFLIFRPRSASGATPQSEPSSSPATGQ